MSSTPQNIITVTGDLGSGKSRVCKLLAERLGSTIVSTGSIQRDIARELNLTTLELNKLSETSPEIDRRIDSQIIALAGSGNLICDSRLAWHFLPVSFKVCLKVGTETAAQRVFADHQRSGEKYASLEDTIRALKARRESEILRFRQTYGVECDLMTNYDLVVDTSMAKPETIAQLIIERMALPTAPHEKGLLWLPPTTLFPTRDVPSDVAVKSSAASPPIDVISTEGLYFIHDGHRRTSAALAGKLPWLPTRHLAEGDQLVPADGTAQAYASNHCDRPRISAWETSHQFHFAKYPHWA